MVRFTSPQSLAGPLAILLTALAAARPPLGAQASTEPGWTPDATRFLEHVRVLSSDAFGGRAPGTPGETKTVEYIADQFRTIGLASAGDEGTYFQKVPLVGSIDRPGPLTFRKGASGQVLNAPGDVVAWTKRTVESAEITDSEVVFAGYGVVAPEAKWDDHKGADLAGKTIIVLIGDPPVPDLADPRRLDPSVFGGPAMTYYGRWTYKFEIGAEKKAAAVLIVHETGSAGYPFSVVQGRLGEQFDLESPDDYAGRAAVEGWIPLDRARALFAMAGQDFDELKRRAATREFRPVPLGITASMRLQNTLRRIESRNVVGRLEGSDPARRSEHVIFTAHWDAFGEGPAIGGETIRHGALDNATGVAGLLELARAYATAPAKPSRSMLFLAVTAEEQLLLGSEYYASRPTVPLDRVAAVLNMEMLNPYGRTRDITVYGLGASELDDYVSRAAARQDRTVRPDPAPEQGWFYRSDHFPFARRGVPAMWVGGGADYVGKPPGYGREMLDEYLANRYHKPADVVRPEWDLGGAMQDLQIYFEVGREVANAARFPEWKPGAEFKATRDEMLRSRRP